MPEIIFPEKLANLPVARSIKAGEIKLDNSFVLVAHTGSGKTMIIPPVIAKNGMKVILRQPTRQTARLTYLGLTKFWGDQLKIGMHTSEEDIGSLDECNIMVCTDGVMKNWLRNPQYKVCVIFDEFHWQQPITEIELAIVKTYLNEGIKFNIILLSATIRPSNVIKYMENLNPHPVSPGDIDDICDTLEHEGNKVNTMKQKQYLKIYYSEGVAFPIENKILNIYEDRETDSAGKAIIDFASRMLVDNKRGLVFLCTRAEVQNTCNRLREILPLLPVEFAHADVDIDSILKFVEDNEPSILFATVSLATSATLPFDEVLIIDKGIDTVYEDGIEKQITNIPIDPNGVLQRRGRTGRVKPGICSLVTTYRESWDEIKPAAIVPPLEKVSPIQAALVCAQYEMDPRRLDTLSRLDPYEISRSVNRLKGMGIVYEDGNSLKLTVLGKKVAAMPLEVELAVMVAQCPEDIVPAVIGVAACDAGIFNIFQTEVKMPDGCKMHGADLIDPTLINPKSILVTKAKIIQGAFKARADEEDTLKQWAETNGLWPKKIEKILFKYFQICSKGNKSERKMREALLAMDIDAKANDIIKYLYNIKMFEEFELDYDNYGGKPGFKGEHFGFFAILDGLDIKLLKLEGRPYVKGIGTKKLIKTKAKNTEICIFGDTTLFEEAQNDA